MRRKSGMSYLAVLLTYILLSLGLCNPASAVPFTWQDDPSSTITFDDLTVSRNGNTFTFSNFHAVNLTNQALPDLAVITPWIFPQFGTTIFGLKWSNADGGWFSNNVNGTSLLITLDNFPGRLRFGNVQNIDGTGPLDPTLTINGVSETLQPDDLVPFLNLGAFAANEGKFFDQIFTYHFGDGRDAPIDTITNGNTKTISQIPEPSTLLLLGIAVLGLRLSRTPDKSPKQAG